MSSSSPSHESSQNNLGVRELLDFYQKKFDELFTKDDKYREKVDKHLKELVADRYELEAEVSRKGEKISDLQRALVDLQLSCFEEKERYLKVCAENEQLKRNEEKLHGNIRELLNVTTDKDLRDRIIYCLKDPSVDVCFGGNHFDELGSDASISKKSTDDFIKEQIQSLQDKLDDYSNISRSKFDVLLEDCKQTLEKSKERLSSNEVEFRKLQTKLHQTETELNVTKQTCSELREIIEKLDLGHNTAEPYSSNNMFREAKYNSATSQTNQSVNQQVDQSYIRDRQQINQSNNLLGKSKSDHATSLENLASITNVKKSDHPINSPLFPPFTFDKKQSKSLNAVVSNASDMQISLVMLSMVLTKLLSILKDIQSTEVFVETANLPKEKTLGPKYVCETNITQLQNYIRQCTRLTFNVKNIWKKLEKAIRCAKDGTQFQSLECDITELESAVDELAVTTAEVDLTCISLSRATFFSYLTGPKQSFEKYGVKDVNHHSKYVSEFKKMEANLKVAKNYNTKAVQIMEKVILKCSAASHEKKLRMNNYGASNENPRYKFQVPSSSKDMDCEGLFGKVRHGAEKLMMTEDSPITSNDDSKKHKASKDRTTNIIQDSLTSKGTNRDEFSRKHVHFGEKLGMTQDFPKAKTDSSRKADQIDYTNHRRTDDFIRKINATLAKINNLENGEYYKDNEFCKHFGEQINSLTDRLKALYEEFNVKSLHEQFAEYSSVTFSKLETLAKQSRDAVIAAEAQISVQRTNAKHLSNKLKNTEELLRESIDECLLLKQKLQILEIKNETEKKKFREHLQHKLNSVQDFDELETAVKEVVSSMEFKDPKKQGTGHKLCEEKIKELSTNNRKLATEIKNETEKRKFRDHLQHRHNSVQDLEPETAVKEVVFSMEFKDPKKPSGPYECLYCKQGTGHKLCEEKIKELRTNNRKLSTEIKLLLQEVKEEKKLSKMSDDQKNRIIQESSIEMKSLKENVQTLEARNACLMEQLKVDKNRLKKMERFRHLEIEGFQTDIKNLKTKIQDLEKQLGKAVSIFGNDRKDMEFLETIHNTTEHSRQAASAIRRLKAKLYELERDFKNL